MTTIEKFQSALPVVSGNLSFRWGIAPEALSPLSIMLAAAEAFQIPYTIHSGFRDIDRQRELYQEWEAGQIANKPAQRSWHTEGRALDVSFGQYQAIFGQIAGMLGIRWGGNFNRADPNHFDVPGPNPPQNAW